MRYPQHQERISKGLFGEEQLIQWFQANGIGFIPVSQSPPYFCECVCCKYKTSRFFGSVTIYWHHCSRC